MDTSVPRKHTFHADVSAFGGQIEQPFERIITAQAPLTLPPDGGYVSARVDSFQVEGLFSFKHAYTQVSGIVSKKKPGWTTLATSVIEGLNVAEILTCDRVVAQIITDHPSEHGKPAPIVNFVGTRFDNLRIGSCQIEVELDLNLCAPTKTDKYGFPEMLTIEDPNFIGKVKEQAGKYNFALPSKNQTLCSLFEGATLKGKLPGTQNGNVFNIPGFGQVTLAELNVDSSSYRLSMLRFQLGCPTKGGLSAGNAISNGSTDPP